MLPLLLALPLFSYLLLSLPPILPFRLLFLLPLFLFRLPFSLTQRVVQLPRPIVVENLGEDARMTVEEVLVQHRIVVGQIWRQSRQPSGWNLLQRMFVRLVTDAAHVENYPILAVHQRRPKKWKSSF